MQDCTELKEMFKAIRNTDSYNEIVGNIGDIVAYDAHFSEEKAKAFLVHLVTAAIGRDFRRDVVLCSWGLLRGFDKRKGVTDRRKDFVRNSGYRGSNASKYPENPTELSDKDIAKLSDSLLKEEEKYYERIAHHLTDTVYDLDDFYSTALDSCFSVKLRKAIIPWPSYLHINNMPINNLLQRNKLFIDRTIISSSVSKNFRMGHNLQLLYGMTGVGKTQMALQYAYQNASRYEVICWVDASNSSRLTRSCAKFITTVDSSANLDLSTADAVRSAFLRYFERRTNCYLIIYDNADYLDIYSAPGESMRELLQSYMPKNDGHILITTRCNCNFLDAKRVSVGLFTPEQSVVYLEQKTGLPRDADAEVLAERLGYLPLALEYAGAYIKELCANYHEYLELWDQYDPSTFFDLEGYAEQTVKQAFDISIDRIKASPDADLVLDFLHLCVMLQADQLPIDHFLEFSDDNYDGIGIRDLSNPDTSPNTNRKSFSNALKNKLQRRELIRKLASYSLIDWDKQTKTITIHPLLAEIIRTNITAADKSRFYSIYRTNLALARAYFENDDYSRSKEYYLKTFHDHELMLSWGIDDLLHHPERLLWNDSIIALSHQYIYVFQDCIIPLGDEALLRRELTKYHALLKATYDIIEQSASPQDCLDALFEDQLYLYQMFTVSIGHQLLWRRWNTPSERVSTGLKYSFGFTQVMRNGSKYIGYPEFEFVKTVVDVWADNDVDFIQAVRRINDEEDPWMVMAVPEEVTDPASLIACANRML